MRVELVVDDAGLKRRIGQVIYHFSDLVFLDRLAQKGCDLLLTEFVSHRSSKRVLKGVPHELLVLTWHHLMRAIGETFDKLARISDCFNEFFVQLRDGISHAEQRLDALDKKDDHNVDHGGKWHEIRHQVSEASIYVLSKVEAYRLAVFNH